jgi:hypothetical protein
MKGSLKIFNSLKEAQSGPAAKISILAGIFPLISFFKDIFSLEFWKVFNGLFEAYRKELSFPIFEIFHQLGVAVSPIFIDWLLFYLMLGMAYIWSYETKFPIIKNLLGIKKFCNEMHEKIPPRRFRSSAFINDVLGWFFFKLCIFVKWLLKTQFFSISLLCMASLAWIIASIRRILFWPILCMRYPFLYENSEIGLFTSNVHTDERRPSHEVFSYMRRERAKQWGLWLRAPEGAYSLLGNKHWCLTVFLLFIDAFRFILNKIFSLFTLFFINLFPDKLVNYAKNNIEGKYIGDMRLIFLFKIIFTFIGALLICMFSYVDV